MWFSVLSGRSSLLLPLLPLQCWGQGGDVCPAALYVPVAAQHQVSVTQTHHLWHRAADFIVSSCTLKARQAGEPEADFALHAATDSE